MTTHICPKCHHIMAVPFRHVCNQASQTTIINNTVVEDSSSDLLSTVAAVEVAEAILDSGSSIDTSSSFDSGSSFDSSPSSDFGGFDGGSSGGGGADSSW